MGLGGKPCPGRISAYPNREPSFPSPRHLCPLRHLEPAANRNESPDASAAAPAPPPAPSAVAPSVAASAPAAPDAVAPDAVAPPAPASPLFDASQPYAAPTRPRGSIFGLSTVLFLAACALGYYKYDEYRKRPPPPPPPKLAKPLREIPLSASPISAFKQAKEMIKVAGEKHKAAYDDVAAMDPATADGTAAPASPLAGAVAAAGAAGGGEAAAPAGGVAAAPAPAGGTTAPGRPPAVPAYTAWANSVKIGGVRPGARPLVIIDSISYEVGDVVNRKLGIRLEALEVERRVVRFRDPTGTVAEIRY